MARVLCLLALIATVSSQSDLDWTSADCGRSKYPDAGQDGDPNIRIINGWEARQGEFPWQAALLYFGAQQCGAVIISNYWVITAAHCLTGADPSAITIVVGQHSSWSEDGTNHDVAHFTMHEDYHELGLMDNDIAVVRLVEPIEMSEDVTPACRPSGTYDSRYSTISGWGLTNDKRQDILLYGNEYIVDQEVCASAACFDPNYWIQPGSLCFGSCDGQHDQSACMGDDGGPLVVNTDNQFDIVGLYSWASYTCLDTIPAVFTNVSFFNEWVDLHADPLTL